MPLMPLSMSRSAELRHCTASYCAAAGDAYLKHIASETGTQVVLKGRSSGMVETPEPVHIFVTGGDQKGNSEAVR